ncbi:MAG TPA: cation:proton antiporter [Candidatus Duodenibacillus intestinavium]|nr:cation:proton antiporter [Candidatus Duodenibacillus intestinavium]
MDHSLPLLFTLALAFVLALIFGCIAEKLKCPALVGFLCAGILCSSHTPGPTADMEIAMQLSEVGVILLMFGVGLHFSISDLLKVKGIAVPGAVLQMTIATLLGLLFAVYVWEWSLSSALIFGLCLSCASTVVLLKTLEMHGHLNTVDGQISVGWLVVEDIATVLILVLLPPVAQIMGVTPGGGEAAEPMTASGIAYVIASTLLHVVAFVAIMMVVGRKFIPWVLWQIAKTGSRELFTLSILTASVGIAYGAAAVFDVSFALGAFFAGMVMRESKYAHRAATDSLPLQDAFSVLFFVGVGMMLDWRVILEEPWSILTMLAIIMIGKSLTAFCLVHFLRYPLHTSLNVGAALAQIGEFSFILAAQGIALGMTDQKMLSMVVASAILSIALNPLMFAMIPYVRRFSVRYFAWARAAAMLTDPYSVLPKETSRRMLMGQTILVGSGSVTRSVAKRLATDDVPFVCISEDKSFAEELREQKHAVISGDAADPMVLVQGHIVTAAQLMVIDIDPVKTLKVVEMAKQLNPELNIMARAGSRDEVEHLKQEGIANVYLDSESVSEVLTGNILDYYKKDEEQDGQDKARTQSAH